MPLVHFPATANFQEWSSKWSHELRPANRKLGRTDRFGALCDNHVFFYAGPCCYYVEGGIGNAAMYFAPGLEHGRTGDVTPFDSGALEPRPRLQPFRRNAASEDKLWSFFRKHCVPLDGWREVFTEWLIHCYDEPNRYIDSTRDRYTAGEPNRTRPQYLLQHNGTRGVAKYGPDECGDRRTWTWEIRVEQNVSMDEVAVLQVGFAAFEDAKAFADDIASRTTRRPHVHVLPPELEASHDTLYADSHNILQAMVRDEAQETP